MEPKDPYLDVKTNNKVHHNSRFIVSQRSYKFRPAVFIRNHIFLQLEPPSEDRTPRYGRIGNFMVSRLGNVNITALGNFLLRPGSETSLPPICKVRERN